MPDLISKYENDARFHALVNWLISIMPNNGFTIEEVMEAAAFATAQEQRRLERLRQEHLFSNAFKTAPDQGCCDDCSQCHLKDVCVEAKKEQPKPMSGMVMAMKLQEEAQKYPDKIAYSIPRIAQIDLLTNELTRKYEGKEKPIDADCYHLLRNIGKYLVELAEEKKEDHK